MDLNKITSGCALIDKFLGGGIQTGQVTELYGESSTGKSNFAFQLVLMAQLPPEKGGLSSGAIYFCTSKSFSRERLVQLCRSFSELHPELNHTDVCEKIYIVEVLDLAKQTFILRHQVPILMKEHNIRLLVMDSIAANFRMQDEGLTNLDRARVIFETGEILHSIALNFEAVVLVLNEVAGNLSKSKVTRIAADTHSKSIETSIRENCFEYIPALGAAFSVVVNSRIRLHRSLQGQRSMHILFSPQAPPASCSFSLDEGGIAGIAM